MIEPESENHSDIATSYYYVGSTEMYLFSAYNRQQIEERHHEEGRRVRLDVHVRELSLYSAPSALCAQQREDSF